MENTQFKQQVVEYLGKVTRSDLVTEIPAESGVFQAVNVPPSRYCPSFVSTKAGRFTAKGEPAKFFATNFPICTAEIGFPSGSDATGIVFVAGKTSTTFDAIDVHRLPEPIKTELFGDRNVATKWEKSHLFMEAVKSEPRFEGINAVFFQSASGQALNMEGSCLLLIGDAPPVTITATGDFQTWKDGDETRLLKS
jgi:hypothetical protein